MKLINSKTRSAVPKKIVLFMDGFEIGGAQRVFITIASKLKQLGYEVELVVAKEKGALRSEVDSSIKIVSLESLGTDSNTLKGILKLIFKLRSYFLKSNPSACLSTITGINLVTVLAWLLAGRPCTLILREACSLKNVSSRLRLIAMQILYPLASYIVVLSPSLRQEMSDKLRIVQNKLVFIGNPLDELKAENMSLHSDDCCLIESLAPYILTIGRLVDQKDHATLIRGFSLSKTMRDLKLVVVGEGPNRQKLEQLVMDLGLEKKVVFVGEKKNPYPWYRHAKAFVLSSRWEGYPNTIVEALHFGLPIVATKYDQYTVTMLENLAPEAHRVVPIGNPAIMAEAIDYILSSSRVIFNSSEKLNANIIGEYEKLLTKS